MKTAAAGNQGGREMPRAQPYQILAMAIAMILLGMLTPGEAQADDGGMDAISQQVLAELNTLRTDPQGYIRYLEEIRDAFTDRGSVRIDGKQYRSQEGRPAVDEAIAFLRTVSPAPTLTGSRPLTHAAWDHILDHGRTGNVGHGGSDGSTYQQRIERYGIPESLSGEDILYGYLSPRAIVIGLLVDDGLPNRGHRSSILNPAFRVAGVAVGPHRRFGSICVIDLADGMTAK